jgi:hypothetical protein
MRNTIFRIIKLALGIGVLTATLGNSGCLVNSGSDLDKLKKLDQAHLRIYQAGDQLTYDVLVDGMNKGTLTIHYDLPASLPETPLENPFDTNSAHLSVLKETTTLEYNGNGPITTVRYITQDQDPSSPTYGSVTLYAFDSQSGAEEHNYVTTNKTASSSNLFVPATIFASPFLDANTFQPTDNQADENIEYYVFPCYEKTNPGQCDSTYNQSLSESFQFSKMIVYNLTNKVAFFETLEVPFSGIVTNAAGGTDQRKVHLDIRTFCGDSTDSSINYSGLEYLFPSIGVIRFEVRSCSAQPSGGFSYLTADLTSVNFSY